MKVSKLLKILQSVPGTTEIYVIDSGDRGEYFTISTVDVESPADGEGEVCIYLCIEVPEAE